MLLLVFCIPKQTLGEASSPFLPSFTKRPKLVHQSNHTVQSHHDSATPPETPEFGGAVDGRRAGVVKASWKQQDQAVVTI